MGFKDITKEEINELQDLINDSFLINMDDRIKKTTILLKQKYQIKLPDAIIVATSIVYAIPLISADKGFNKIEELDFILIEK